MIIRNRRSWLVLFSSLATLAMVACGRSVRPSPSAAPSPSPTVPAIATPAGDRVAAIKTSFAQGTPPPPVPTSPPDTRFGISGISFIDPGRGWILAVSEVVSEVLYTADAGKTWARQYTGAIIGSQIDFVDASHGWVIGRDACPGTPGPNCRGVLLSTSDGGATWVRSSPSSEWLIGIAFASPTDGWALAVQNCNTCRLAHLLRTRDGGATWQAVTLPSARYPFSSRTLFRFGNAGIIATSNAVFVTHDDGATWVAHGNGCDPRAFLYTAWFLDPLHGWTVCGDGRAGGTVAEKFVYATTDGGLSWTLRSEFLFDPGTPPAGVGLAPGPGPSDLVFATAPVGWMSTNLGLFETGDGGESWSRLWDPEANFGTLRFLNDRQGFAALNVTSIAVTTDGGATWLPRPLPP